MKKTYLILRDKPDGTQYLDIASEQEWHEIIKNNSMIQHQIHALKNANDSDALSEIESNAQIKDLSDQLRYFIKDLIVEGASWDQLIYETSRLEYLSWSRQYAHQKDNWKLEKYYGHVYLDAPVFDEDLNYCSMGDIIPSPVSPIELLEDEILLDSLRQALAAWKPWATDMLEIYLDNGDKNVNACFGAKYCITRRQVDRYKARFIVFVKKFLFGRRLFPLYSPRLSQESVNSPIGIIEGVQSNERNQKR